MKRFTLTFLILAALALAPTVAPAQTGGFQQCTQDLIDAGVCADLASWLMSYDGEQADMDDLIDGIAYGHAYTDTVECTPELVPTYCTGTQIGDQIPNPVLKVDYASEVMLRILKSTVLEFRDREAAADAIALVNRIVLIR